MIKPWAASLLLASGLAHAGAAATADVPEHVKYTPASAGVTDDAERRLRAALASGPAAFAELLDLDNEESSVKLGAYFGLEIDADNLKGRNVLGRGKYRVENFVGGSEGIVESFGAVEAAQKRFMAHYLFLAADLENATIRPPNFDELAIVWYWIGWDLEGPLLVAETPKDKYLFDFDAKSGHITWIERLTNPCFTGKQEDREVMGCHCARVAREAKRATVWFEELKSCPTPTAANPPAAPNQPPSSKQLQQIAAQLLSTTPVYLRVTDRSARVDFMMARAFAGKHTLIVIGPEEPGYRGPGKMLEGKAPQPLRDASGERIPSYVLLGSVIGPDGRMQETRVLLSTGEPASAAALEAAKGWRVEPATHNGQPVAEMFWQELPF